MYTLTAYSEEPQDSTVPGVLGLVKMLNKSRDTGELNPGLIKANVQFIFQKLRQGLFNLLLFKHFASLQTLVKQLIESPSESLKTLSQLSALPQSWLSKIFYFFTPISPHQYSENSFI